MMRNTSKGFTIIELLVVITLVIILSFIVYLFINPTELTKRSRDSIRLSDLDNLRQAINLAFQESIDNNLNVLCNSNSYPCSGDTIADSQFSDGTGWVKVNLAGIQSISNQVLPIDPLNSPGESGNHYLYCANVIPPNNQGWEIVAVLESVSYSQKMTTDGGLYDDKYEIGSHLSLLNSFTNCTY